MDPSDEMMALPFFEVNRGPQIIASCERSEPRDAVVVVGVAPSRGTEATLPSGRAQDGPGFGDPGTALHKLVISLRGTVAVVGVADEAIVDVIGPVIVAVHLNVNGSRGGDRYRRPG